MLIIIVLLFVGNLERSRVGRAWVAIREDEDAAEIMGVPTFKFKLWAFVIGAAIGGMSGALYAGQVQFVVPTNFNVINSVLFLCAVVLGGQGNKLGVILGAFIIVYLPNFFLGRTELLGIPINGNEIAAVQVPVLRPRADGADDLPAAGPDSGPAEAADLRSRAVSSRPAGAAEAAQQAAEVAK